MIPLSTRMRPAKLEDFVGQEHFLTKNSLIYNSIKNGTFKSAVFFGPSGTGKTTLARIIAGAGKGKFVELNASAEGIKELKNIISSAHDSLFSVNKESIYVFIDEFHRWNKLQQDSLLKALEEGTVNLICSTTENPYFSINNAIISRIGSIYEFKPLSDENILALMRRALLDEANGLGRRKLNLRDDILEYIASISAGDARIALDNLEFIADNLAENCDASIDEIAHALQKNPYFFDRREDYYDMISALQKSVRGSDPDAAIFYLAKLMDGGTDIRAIGRRLVVMATEDVSMAYPNAVVIVNSCVEAALLCGYPEAMIPLAHATVFLASCPKSNAAYMALSRALKDIRSRRISGVPPHLKDSHYKGAASLKRGLAYKNPHEFGGYVEQQYLPDSLFREAVRYYFPGDNGQESKFASYLESLKPKSGPEKSRDSCDERDEAVKTDKTDSDVDV